MENNINMFEDKGNFWYCDCYGPNCMKLSIEKNPEFDNIPPEFKNDKTLISYGIFFEGEIFKSNK